MARHTVNNKDVTILWCTLEVSVPLCNEKLYSVSLSCDILHAVILGFSKHAEFFDKIFNNVYGVNHMYNIPAFYILSEQTR